MIGKRTHPMIGKLSEILVSVNRSNPFSDFKISPKRFHDNSLGGGVGLGIVAALDNNSTARPGILRFGRSRPVHPKPECNRSGSDPVPIRRRLIMDEEDYTYVTCHRGLDGSNCTRVYRDGFECYASKIRKPERSLDFCECFDETPDISPENSPEFEGLGFLNACFLCRKQLHGLDVYMYRGEKAFCSEECRSIHITSDERRESCRSDFSTSPYNAGQIFSAGVLAI